MSMDSLNVGQAQNEYDLFTGGISQLWPLIRKLISMNIIDDAMKLLDMIFSSPEKYTVAQLKAELAITLKKLNINADGRPLAPRLMLSDEDAPEIRAMTSRKPISGEVINHLEALGVNVNLLSDSLVLGLINIAGRYGLPYIQRPIDRILTRQKSRSKITFGDLANP